MTFEGHFSTVVILCAQLTRDLSAITKFLVKLQACVRTVGHFMQSSDSSCVLQLFYVGFFSTKSRHVNDESVFARVKRVAEYSLTYSNEYSIPKLHVSGITTELSRISATGADPNKDRFLDKRP